ncbi:MAG: sugar phosphate isomerase/epimerase [Verrucomicrobiae bacterium]|nr:sugar phosphate isomerase/epimerase [Verrucomicrobiae bacterium]
MNTPVTATRRGFLQAIAGAAAVAITPLASLQAQKAPHIRLGLETYSIRGLKWKAPKILEYAASLKLDAVMMNPSNFEGADEAYFKQLGEQARRMGIKIQPAFGSICERSTAWRPKEGNPVKYLLQCIHQTKALGADRFRTLMGVSRDREQGLPIDAMMEATIKNLRSVRQQALDAGVKIALENHGDLHARQLKTLIEEAGKDFVGCCFDAGNPVRMLEDPVASFEILGPYTLATHMRDSVVFEHPRGAAYQWVALGDGMIDFKRIVSRFAELCPESVFFLEIVTGRRAEVLPYFEPDFWKMYPKADITDFAKFLALARKGQPFTGNMIIADDGKQPPEYEAALIQQQRIDSERSIEYAKKSLDIGLNWKA